MTRLNENNVSTLWIMLLTLAATAASLLFACATPFTALAALAATQMRARDGMLLMLAVWAANQTVGFCVLSYPHTPKTMVWGVAIGMAAVAAVPAARAVLARIGGGGELMRIAVAYLVASVAFKLVILLWALQLGGVATTLSPSITARLFVRDAAMLAGLYALYRLVVAAGLPRPRRLAAA